MTGIPVRLDPSALRQLVIEQSHRAHVGHIASALSIADVVAVLFSGVIRRDTHQRDVFVLSKGHAALALYCALELRGELLPGQLDTYCADGSLLGVHPEHQLSGVDFSTGSLGHGLSLAVGSALGARMNGSGARVYALLSDAEMNEGSTWEAVMFAAHHCLDQLLVIIDKNGQQALGKTADVLSMDPLTERWKAFGWHVLQVDGHRVESIESAMSNRVLGKPTVIIATTVAGKGVSFMEGQVKWHYLPVSDAQYAQALSELAR